MSEIRKKPVIYLTNKELLAEINRCKKSYCYFVDKEYEDFDGIVQDLDDITKEFVDELCEKKSKEITPKKSTPVVVDPVGLVIRYMTYEHIPLDPDRKKRSRAANQTHAHVIFPPFKHYVIDAVNADGTYEIREVGRSFWEGGLENGWFSPQKGRMTERMGRMFQLLVERYGYRSNWRGYCYSSDTELLTKRGWLTHSEITKKDIALSYDIPNKKLVWSPIRDIYRSHYEGNMFHLTVRGMDALVSPGHKFITVDDGLKSVEMLREKDRVILMGEGVSDDSFAKYDDNFVELVGWVVTEGSFYHRKESKLPRLTIYQNAGLYAERIRKCLKNLSSKYSEYHRDRLGNGKVNIAFNLRKDITGELIKVIDGVYNGKKILNKDFIISLTSAQRELLIQTMIDGDGWRTMQEGRIKVGYAQKDKEHMDAFVMLCTLSGYQISVKSNLITQKSKKITEINTATFFSKKRNITIVENIDMHGAKRSGIVKGKGKESHPNEPTIPYNGTIWCITTNYGTVVARRNGYVYTCSNSYNDEMQSLAIVQLAQVGLQFDESKSSNPFAFYTTTITNCFTRILNVEKKNQELRDDLLVSNGAAPSYTRQIANELSRSGSIEPTPFPRRKGRKTAAQVHAEKETDKAEDIKDTK